MVRSWSLVIFPKFNSPMPQEIVRTVVTSAWAQSVPELCPLTLFSFRSLLERARAGRFDGAMWNLFGESLSTRLRENLWQRQQQRIKDAQNDKSRSSATRFLGTSGLPRPAPCPRKARASSLVCRTRLQRIPPPALAATTLKRRG